MKNGEINNLVLFTRSFRLGDLHTGPGQGSHSCTTMSTPNASKKCGSNARIPRKTMVVCNSLLHKRQNV